MLTTPRVATSKYNLALLRRQRNVTDIARKLFGEREQIYITVYGPDHSKQIYASVYGPDHRSTLACTDLTTARRWMQHGKLVVVCSDTAQITKISQTTKENAFSTFFVCVPGLPTRTHTHTRARAHTHTHTRTINIQFALTSAVPRSNRAAAQCVPRHGKEA